MFILFLQSIFAILYVASVVGFKYSIKKAADERYKKVKHYEGDVGYYLLALFWPLIGLLSLAYDGWCSLRSPSVFK